MVNPAAGSAKGVCQANQSGGSCLKSIRPSEKILPDDAKFGRDSLPVWIFLRTTLGLGRCLTLFGHDVTRS
jgi:hypothetical protein